MNKKEWIEQRKKLFEHLETAEKNMRTATDQKEELDLTIDAYNIKIKTFK